MWEKGGFFGGFRGFLQQAHFFWELKLFKGGLFWGFLGPGEMPPPRAIGPISPRANSCQTGVGIFLRAQVPVGDGRMVRVCGLDGYW